MTLDGSTMPGIGRSPLDDPADPSLVDLVRRRPAPRG